MRRLLDITAQNFSESVNVFNFILIPVLGSRIKSATTLLVNPGTWFVVPPVKWCGVVGTTGTMKTPLISTVTRPLNKAQKGKWKDYKEACETYETELRKYKSMTNDEKRNEEDPTPPKPMQDIYFSDFTIEAMIASMSGYPEEGYLINTDELAGFFGSMDAYKSTPGSDRPKWLEAWNGEAIKSTRKSGSSYASQTSISIVGGIQPGTIEALVKNDKSKHDGMWSRFTFIRIEHTYTELFTSIDGSLSDCLDEIYALINEEPAQQHTIDPLAKPLCTAWHNLLQHKIDREGDNNPLMVGVYAKMIGITFRNALILHRTNAAIEKYEAKRDAIAKYEAEHKAKHPNIDKDSQVPPVPKETIDAAMSNSNIASAIPMATIEAAIAWTKWEMNQTLLEYKMLGLTDYDDPDALKVLKFIHKFGGDAWLSKHSDGWVSPRDVRVWWSGSKKPSGDVIKKFMSKVVELGHAINNTEKFESEKYKIKINTGKSSPSSPPTPEDHTPSHSQHGLDLVHALVQENPEDSHSNGLGGWTRFSDELVHLVQGTDELLLSIPVPLVPSQEGDIEPEPAHETKVEVNDEDGF